MHKAIHPNRMVLEHTVVREVVTFLYQESHPLPEGAFQGKLGIWYVEPVPGGQESIEIHCEHTGVFYEHFRQRQASGEYATLQDFEDFILRRAAAALQWKLGRSAVKVN